MPVEVWTARWWTRDPDRFDITRGTGTGDGLAFAPSWKILGPALEARRLAKEAEEQARRALVYCEDDNDGDMCLQQGADDAMAIEAQAWETYAAAYRLEMLESRRVNRAAWDRFLARHRVVLVCKCPHSARCHRGLLAGYSGKMGADVRGELPS